MIMFSDQAWMQAVIHAFNAAFLESNSDNVKAILERVFADNAQYLSGNKKLEGRGQITTAIIEYICEHQPIEVKIIGEVLYTANTALLSYEVVKIDSLHVVMETGFDWLEFNNFGQISRVCEYPRKLVS